jgi:histidyl-tRNA synthetase
MSAEFQGPRGTLDWYGPRAALRRSVLDEARRVFESAGYGQMVTPTFEDTGVYRRTSGEGSDVVRKEMYSFRDRSERELTLRPEGTAGVMRAYLEHGLHRQPQPVKIWYELPMFRYNRVQKGRYREHYQFGAEAVGSEDPALDAELIALQARWYRNVDVTGLSLLLNSIGDETCRPAYLELLTAFLDAHLDELDDECRERRRTNPLRVFDCKNAGCQSVLAGAPRITDHLCDACREHFAGVRADLDARGVGYTVSSGLVRGLDYYTRTAWEWQWPALGAQSTLSGGGRYDGLAGQLGGPPTPGVGFGAGVERLVLTLEETGAAEAAEPALDVLFAVLVDAARPRMHALMDEARAGGLRSDAAFGGRRLKRALELAARRQARRVVIVGEDEWSAGEASVRDMASGEQHRVALDDLVGELSR